MFNFLKLQLMAMSNKRTLLTFITNPIKNFRSLLTLLTLLFVIISLMYAPKRFLMSNNFLSSHNEMESSTLHYLQFNVHEHFESRFCDFGRPKNIFQTQPLDTFAVPLHFSKPMWFSFGKHVSIIYNFPRTQYFLYSLSFSTFLNSTITSFKKPSNQLFTLNLNESASFNIFCQKMIFNMKLSKTTQSSDLLNFQRESLSFHFIQNKNHGWMNGCAQIRLLIFHLVKVFKLIRLFMQTSKLTYHAVHVGYSPVLLGRFEKKLSLLCRPFKPSNSFYFLLFLLLCGDIHPNPGPVFRPHRRHPKSQSITVGAWNVRTLLENKRSHARPTAIVARTLSSYNIDICALSETRLSGENIITEPGGGYTFFLKGRPEDETPQIHGVGFAIRSSLLSHLNGNLPIGLSERLMKLSIPTQGRTLHVISAYAPTLNQSDSVKEQFYHQLSQILSKIPRSDKILLLGDFNARVGTDHEGWQGVLGKHGIGKENSNGTKLLSLCSQENLIVTNTMFHQAERYKSTWMHPGTKKWHLIDYVITRQRDLRDILHTRAMCGSLTWSDHKLVKCKLAIHFNKPNRHQSHRPLRKLNVNKLRSSETKELLGKRMSEAFNNREILGGSSEATLVNFSKITWQVSENVLGFPERKHRDWFDENDRFIQPLLKELRDLRCQLTLDKNNSVLNALYLETKKNVNTRLHNMQNAWWIARAEEIQDAADKRDYKSFWQGLKAIYGPKYQSYPSIKSKDGKTLITDPKGILNRWVEHFDSVLNQPSDFDMSVLDKLPQWEVNPELGIPPTLKEIEDSIKQLTAGKAAGADGIPPDVFKHGGPTIPQQLLKLFKQSWHEGKVPQAFKDAELVHLYKNKGDVKCCDNHRGISLLCIAGKIYARVLLNRLVKHIKAIRLIPETQCGFEAGRSTIDPCFVLRQLQEKCRLHGRDLYLLFVDLTKAFDTVNREGLWALLRRIGCPDHFISIIQSFHDGMRVTVREGLEKAEPFVVTSGTKQGCVLAPTLFSIFFSLMLFIAFENANEGVEVYSRFDRGLLNTDNVHLKARTKVESTVIRDLLFADDCALATSSHHDLQRLCDNFASAATKFGLKISIDKTESMYQAPSRELYQAPEIYVGEEKLKAVKTFKYLGSIVSDDTTMDAEISARLVRANSAYNKLTKRLWRKSGIRLVTKISVYRAAVLSSLLYGSEAWTLPRKQVRRLERFHLSCLRKIAGIRWYHKRTNYQVLEKCSILSITSMLHQNKLRWIGHVIRMDEDRIPKRMLYGRLALGSSKRGNHLTYINGVKNTLRSCTMHNTHLEEQASNRSQWRNQVKIGVLKAEEDYRSELLARYTRKKVNRNPP